MWSYYGAKTTFVQHYPQPVHDTIIEPFAGTARYALKYFDKQVILIDKYEALIGVWKFLQAASENDVASLYVPQFKERILPQNYDCQAAYDLVGWQTWGGSKSPVRVSQKTYGEVKRRLKRIAAQLYKIRHWQIQLGDYNEAPDIEATWFIDPPYQNQGKHYKVSSKLLDFGVLAEWCKSRKGQVMVCETMDATWLPFRPLWPIESTMKHKVHRLNDEAIWCNFPTEFDLDQLTLWPKEVFEGTRKIV